MAIELKVPAVGESITEVEIGEWFKKEGDLVEKNENVVTLESEKATVELPSPGSGRLGKILKQAGQTAAIGEVIGHLEPDEKPSGQPAAQRTPPSGQVEKEEDQAAPGARDGKIEADSTAEAKAAPEVRPQPQPAPPAESDAGPKISSETPAKPAKADEPGAAPDKSPLPRAVQDEQAGGNRQKASFSPPPATAPAPERAAPQPRSSQQGAAGRDEEVVPMTRLRRTVAEHLLQAQQTMALLTTFNEIDMTAVMALRKEYGEAFQTRYEVKLGFMSFFVKAAIEALKLVPQVNAIIRDQSIVYRNYFDIGVAIGGGKGLVVPVIRRAERLSFAEIEKAIGQFARRARENKLTPDDLQGGTFTITNGGIYGSLLSTPIVNPPQSGILGMHAIQERPVVRDNAIVIRSMMYVALTYDHRLVDGREAVTFLKRVKEIVENPARMLLEV